MTNDYDPEAVEMRLRHADGDEVIDVAMTMYEVLETLENDDGSIPEFVWEMRNAALAKARGES